MGARNSIKRSLLSCQVSPEHNDEMRVSFRSLKAHNYVSFSLCSFHAASYGTRCDTKIFDRLNDRWTTNPRTCIPGLYMAGSDAFLPAVCGAMYGGILGAVSILGYVGSIKFVLAFLSEFATSLQQENPKMSRFEAYVTAFHKFGTEPVAN